MYLIHICFPIHCLHLYRARALISDQYLISLVYKLPYLIYRSMEYDLLKQTRKSILHSLAQISFHKFNQLIALKRPACLVNAKKALELLFTIPVNDNRLYSQIGDFESLTFSLFFSKNQITGAKAELLKYLFQKPTNEHLQEPLLKSVLDFILLVENLLAFIETHHLMLIKYSNEINLKLSEEKSAHKNSPSQQALDQVQKIEARQKLNQQQVLKLAVEDLKYKVTDHLETHTYTVEESDQKEVADVAEFTVDEARETAALPQQIVENEFAPKFSERGLTELHSSASDKQPAEQPFENQLELQQQHPDDQEITRPPQQSKQLSQKNSEPELERQALGDEDHEAQDLEAQQEQVPHQELNQIENHSSNAQQEPAAEQNHEDSERKLTRQTSLPKFGSQKQDKEAPILDKSQLEQLLRDQSPEALSELPKNQFVRTELSPNRSVSLKMAALQSLVSESLFSTKKSEQTEGGIEGGMQMMVQSMFERPSRVVKPRTGGQVIFEERPTRMSLFNYKR